MQNTNHLFKEYQFLSKEVHKHLFDKRLSPEEADYMRNEFIDGFYRILRHSVKLSVTPEELERFISEASNPPTQSEIERFGGYLLEKESSYALMNEYLRRFLEIVDIT